MASTPGEEALDFARRGDEAFDQGRYAEALNCYAKAEEETIDPGLIALNEGAALYRLGRFREAEQHYARCLEDAASERHARVCFDLGNSLVQQARERDAKLLRRAIASYETCLRNPDAGPDLIEDARYNLALSRALLAKAKARQDTSSSEDQEHDTTPNESDPNEQSASAEQAGQPGGSDPARAAQAGGQQGTQAQATAAPPPPGRGNLPPIPDQEKMAPLSAEDTAAYLRQVAERVLRERREHHQRRLTPPSWQVEDW
jgi:tetratricopeptide (TPR) repeat protein